MTEVDNIQVRAPEQDTVHTKYSACRLASYLMPVLFDTIGSHTSVIHSTVAHLMPHPNRWFTPFILILLGLCDFHLGLPFYHISHTLCSLYYNPKFEYWYFSFTIKLKFYLFLENLCTENVPVSLAYFADASFTSSVWVYAWLFISLFSCAIVEYLRRGND